MPAQVIQLAINDLNSGKFDQAQRRLSHFIEHCPSDPDGYYYLAAMYSRRHETDLASVYLSKAFGCSGNIAQRMQILKAMLHIGRAPEALTLSSNEPLLRQPHDLVISWSQLQAHLMWHAGKYHDALAQYEALNTQLSDDPQTTVSDRVNGLASLAKAQIRLGQFHRATELLEAGVRRYAQDAVSLVDLLALLRLDRGETDAAISLWRYCARLQPETARFAHTRAVLAAEPINLDALQEPDRSRVAGSLWVNSEQPRWHKAFRWWGFDTALLQYAVSQVPATGCVVECGVFHGRSLNLLGGWTDHEIHGFDSFEGIPEAWGDREPAGAYSTHSKVPTVADHVRLHAGWFRDTLPSFVADQSPDIALLHVDCDLYSSTMDVMTHLAPCLMDGALIVFDDFLGYPGYEKHEFRAFVEYMASCTHGIATLTGATLLDRAVAYRWTRHAED